MDTASTGTNICTLFMSNGSSGWAYSLTSNPGNQFQISGASLQVAGALTDGVYAVGVQAVRGATVITGSMMVAVTPTDFPVPVSTKTTLAQFHTMADVQSQSFGAGADTAMSDSPYGSTAILVTMNGGTNYYTSKTILGTGLDARNGTIRFTFKPFNVNLTSFEIRLFSAGTPSSPSANYHSQGGISGITSHFTRTLGVNNGVFESIGYPVNQFKPTGTGADLTALKYAALYGRGSAGGMFCVGDIDFYPNLRTKAAVIPTFDDAWASAYTIARPLMQAALGGACPIMIIPGAVADPVNGVGGSATGGSGKITWAQIDEIWAAGGQLGAGMYSTEDVNIVNAMTAAQRTLEFQKVRALALQHGHFRDTADFGYQSGIAYSNLATLPQIKSTFRSAMNGLAGINANPPFAPSELLPFGDQWSVQRLQHGLTGGTGSQVWTIVQYALDIAVANKGVFFLDHHDDLYTNPDVYNSYVNLINYVTVLRPDVIEFKTMRSLQAPSNGDDMTK
ncbi:hypothetical protein UP06_32810 [Bradyrhizobium sp. LTSP857]|nr:hypothetical protein UP06_32810 [Bradyrhizobium sp. LTSP857]